MRRSSALFIVVLLGGVAGLAQQPSDPATSSQGNPSSSSSQSVIQPSTDEPEDHIPLIEREKHTTPLEEREKEIRKFDPLGKDDDQDAEEKAKEKARDRDAQKRRDSGQTPLPGSIAESDARDAAQTNNNGPQVIGQDDNTDDQNPAYTGPSVLSHSYMLNTALIPDDLNWRTNASVSGVWDSGINAYATGPQGNVVNASSWGLNFNWGISGRHKFHRDSIGIMYNGNRPWYRVGDQYAGLSSRLGLDYTHIISRRLSVRFMGMSNIFSQSFALQNPGPGLETPAADLNVAATPSTEVFDNGSKSFTAGLTASYQLSSRLAFTAGMNYFVSMFNNPGLTGVSGQQVEGGLNYRLSSRATTGVFYSYSVYKFPHGLATSDSNSIGGLYSYAFNRSTQVRLRMGIATSESLSLETVPLLPAIAQLYGFSSEVIEGYFKSMTEDISASLTRDFGHKQTVTFAYSKGISPGNGLYLTAVFQSMTASTSRKLWGRVPLSITSGRSSYSSETAGLGKYVTEFVSINTSRPFNTSMAMTFGANYRHFNIGAAPGLSNEYSFSYGFSWNHTDDRLWPPW